MYYQQYQCQNPSEKPQVLLKISLPGFKKAQSLLLRAFESNSLLDYGRIWGEAVRVLSVQVGVLPTLAIA
jgi:hypothetical protein